jgi:SMC interacting uncharacterized protein involved in chromosome segregation
MSRRKTKLYPSQIKYQENNPIVSFRLKKEYKERVQKILEKENISVSKWVSDFIEGRIETFEIKEELTKLNTEKAELEKEIDELEEEIDVLNDKIEDKIEDLDIIRFKVPCKICGEDIIFTDRKKNWNTTVYPELRKAFKSWRHGDCK